MRAYALKHQPQPEWLLDTCPEPRSLANYSLLRCGDLFGFCARVHLLNASFCERPSASPSWLATRAG